MGTGNQPPNPDVEIEMSKVLFGGLCSKIYRKAYLYYLKKKQTGETQAYEAKDIDEIKLLAEELLRYGQFKDREQLKSELLDWAANYSEVHLRDNLDELVQSIFTWGV